MTVSMCQSSVPGKRHAALQPALPPDAAGSHVSRGSSRPLPHAAELSASSAHSLPGTSLPSSESSCPTSRSEQPGARMHNRTRTMSLILMEQSVSAKTSHRWPCPEKERQVPSRWRPRRVPLRREQDQPFHRLAGCALSAERPLAHAGMPRKVAPWPVRLGNECPIRACSSGSAVLWGRAGTRIRVGTAVAL
jgi:hypothetical protein